MPLLPLTLPGRPRIDGKHVTVWNILLALCALGILAALQVRSSLRVRYCPPLNKQATILASDTSFQSLLNALSPPPLEPIVV